MNFIQDTDVNGCGIRFEKNHNGQWTAFPMLQLNEKCDGLSSTECMRLADALRTASHKVNEMNAQENTEMLFEG
jgi:hypothetical protein